MNPIRQTSTSALSPGSRATSPVSARPVVTAGASADLLSAAAPARAPQELAPLAPPAARAAGSAANLPALPYTLQVLPEDLATHEKRWSVAPGGPGGWARGLELDCMVQVLGLAATPPRCKAELSVEEARLSLAASQKTVEVTRAALATAQTAAAEAARSQHPLAPMLARTAQRELDRLHGQLEMAEDVVRQDSAWLTSQRAYLDRLA